MTFNRSLLSKRKKPSSSENERLHPKRDPCKFGSTFPIWFESPLISALESMVYSSWFESFLFQDPNVLKLKATSPLLADENDDLGTMNRPNIVAIQSLASSISLSPSPLENSWTIDTTNFHIEQEDKLLAQIKQFLVNPVNKNYFNSHDCDIGSEDIKRVFDIQRPTLKLYQPWPTPRLIIHDNCTAQECNNHSMMSRYVGTIFVGVNTEFKGPVIRTTTNHSFQTKTLEWNLLKRFSPYRGIPQLSYLFVDTNKLTCEVPAFAEGTVLFLEYQIYCKEYSTAPDNYLPVVVGYKNHNPNRNPYDDDGFVANDDNHRDRHPLISGGYDKLLDLPEISFVGLQTLLTHVDEVMSLSSNTNLALPLYHEYKSCNLKADYLEYVDYPLLLALASTGKYTLGLTYVTVYGYSEDGFFFKCNYEGKLTHPMEMAYTWNQVNETLQEMLIDTNHVLNRRACSFHFASNGYRYQTRLDDSDDEESEEVLFCVVVIARL